MAVLMPQAFQRPSVQASTGAGEGGGGTTAPQGQTQAFKSHRGLNYPKPTGGGHLDPYPHTALASASLAQNPDTLSHSSQTCGFFLTQMGEQLFFPVTGPWPAIFQLL